MLDFTFSEEQNMLRAMVRDFGRKELADSYKDRVKAGILPPELIKKVADLGLMGLNIPEEYGGYPKDAVTVGVVLEELARHADDGAWLVFNNFALGGIVALGCDELKKEWLPAMAAGEKIVCMGATEAEAGSDLGNLRTTYKKDGDFFVLNGEKNRVTFAEQGHAVMVLAKADLASKKIVPFGVCVNSNRYPALFALTAIYAMRSSVGASVSSDGEFSFIGGIIENQRSQIIKAGLNLGLIQALPLACPAPVVQCCD